MFKTTKAIELISTSLYDTERLKLEKNCFFCNPIGTYGKTILDTNMYSSAVLQNGESFVIEELHIMVDSPTILIFHVGSKWYGQHKLWGDNKFKILPIKIEELQNFYWEVFGTVGEKVTINMLGMLSRPVNIKTFGDE